MSVDGETLLELASEVVKRARDRGADVAEAVLGQSVHLSAKVRLGEPELVEEAGERSLGLRVMRGKRVAVTHTSDLSSIGLTRLAEDALELAALSEEDPCAGPPEPEVLSARDQHPDLDLFDAAIDEVGADEALRRATEAERAAMDHDPRITNTDGAVFARVSGMRALVTSGGFTGLSRGTYGSITVNPVVDDAEGKKRSGYYWSARRYLEDLESEEAVGREAARRTLDMLGPRKLESQECPVIFERDAARSILGLLGSCISGGAIWRRSSYLADRLDSAVASELVTVVDDPLLARGLGSRGYDGEGLLSRRNVLVEGGVLRSFLLDSYSGRKLSMPTTANASRGGSGGVGVGSSNLSLEPGTMSHDQLVKDTPRGFYVTRMMGFGFNAVTGDFSRGAAGFWVQDGALGHAVSEVTISLNLDDMLKGIDAVADDTDDRSATRSPTFRIAKMTVAGR